MTLEQNQPCGVRATTLPYRERKLHGVFLDGLSASRSAHTSVWEDRGLPGLVFVLAIFVSVLLVACDGESVPALPTPVAESASPRDISEVLDEPPVISEVTARSATILAITSLDVVCGIAYGPTTAYGMTATDTDMAGGGHSDHHPVITGLQPDTLYHYKFGGIGPDGTVYTSRDFTFRTLAEDSTAAAPPRGDNLALLARGGRVVASSSNFGGGDNDSVWGANNAVDGDPSTQWSSDGDGDDAWIEIALASETHVTSVGFWTRTMGSSAQVSSFRVLTDRGEVAGPFELADATSIHRFDTDLTTSRVRFEVAASSGGNTGAVELEVYGELAK